jgi:3-oxoacyl-[acyl-carrier protein] reductase
MSRTPRFREDVVAAVQDSPRRIALVTGSARGIGRAAAEALIDSGHDVIGLDVRRQDQGRMVRTIELDLADPGAIDALCREIGRVDVLVNNAAILLEKPFDDVTVEEFEHLVAVNQRAVFLLCQGLGGQMRDRRWGRIVNVSSIGGRTGGYTNSGVYAMTKAAVLSLTRSFARYLGPHGVTVNAVAPGLIDTEMAREQSQQYQGPQLNALQVAALRRTADASEVAAVIDFLASERASFVTGATIDVNGGWLMV